MSFIAVMDGDDELFRIASISNTEIKWADDTITTTIKFEKAGEILKEIVIDLSGTAFSNKKDLSIIFDAPEEEE